VVESKKLRALKDGASGPDGLKRRDGS